MYVHFFGFEGFSIICIWLLSVNLISGCLETFHSTKSITRTDINRFPATISGKLNIRACTAFKLSFCVEVYLRKYQKEIT